MDGRNLKKEDSLTLVQRLKDSLGGGGVKASQKQHVKNQVPDYRNRSVHLRRGNIRDTHDDIFALSKKRKSPGKDEFDVDSRRKSQSISEDLDSYKTTQVIDVDNVPDRKKSLLLDQRSERWRPGLSLDARSKPGITFEDLDIIKGPGNTQTNIETKRQGMYQGFMGLSLGKAEAGFDRLSADTIISNRSIPSPHLAEAEKIQRINRLESGTVSLSHNGIETGSPLSSASSDSKLTIDDDTRELVPGDGTSETGLQGYSNKSALVWLLLGFIIGILVALGIFMIIWTNREECERKCGMAGPEKNSPNYSARIGNISTENKNNGSDASCKNNTQITTLEILVKQYRNDLLACNRMRQHTISTTTHIPEIDWAYTPTIERNVTGKIRQGRENSIFNNPGSDSATSEDADDKVFEGRDDDLSTQPYLGITYSPTTEHGNETPETLNDIKEDASTDNDITETPISYGAISLSTSPRNNNFNTQDSLRSSTTSARSTHSTENMQQDMLPEGDRVSEATPFPMDGSTEVPQPWNGLDDEIESGANAYLSTSGNDITTITSNTEDILMFTGHSNSVDMQTESTQHAIHIPESTTQGSNENSAQNLKNRIITTLDTPSSNANEFSGSSTTYRESVYTTDGIRSRSLFNSIPSDLSTPTVSAEVSTNSPSSMHNSEFSNENEEPATKPGDEETRTAGSESVTGQGVEDFSSGLTSASITPLTEQYTTISADGFTNKEEITKPPQPTTSPTPPSSSSTTPFLTKATPTVPTKVTTTTPRPFRQSSSNAGTGRNRATSNRKRRKGWFQRLVEAVKEVINNVTPFRV